MGHELRIRIKTLVMVLAMVVCANVGDLMLKRGMTQIGAVEISPVGLQHALLSTITNGTIWIGIFFLTGFMFSYMTVLSWADYSYVMPAGAFGYALLTLLAVVFLHETVMPAGAFGYALLTLLAVVFLHETVSPRRWVGVFLICIGVLLVGQTRPRTTEAVVREVAA